MKWILPLVALLCMSAGASSDVLHGAKLDFIQGKKSYNKKDYKNAKKFYARACHKGLSDVCNTLAFMYMDGVIESNYSEMITVLDNGCERDNAQSCMLLATTYKAIDVQHSDSKKATEAKTKGCKLLENSTPQWQAHGKMEKWNCFAKVEPEVELEPEVTTSSEVFTDNRTGLMWQNESNYDQYTWSKAIVYCKDLTLGGHYDWRLPHIEELKNLYTSKSSLKNVYEDFYWSSDTDDSSDEDAYSIRFMYGRQFSDSKSSNSYVRCVRGEVKQVKRYSTSKVTRPKSTKGNTRKLKRDCKRGNVSACVSLKKSNCKDGRAKDCYSIALKYRDGKDVTKDYEKARKYFKKGCAAGYALSCFQIGRMYDVKNDMRTNHYKAVKFYTKSCDGGFAMGCYNLAHKYYYGKGVRKDKSKASELYAKACRGGHTDGCKYVEKTYKIIKIPSNDTLNVRRGAGTHNDKVGELAYNARGVNVLKCKKAPNGKKWCKVKHHSIPTGWVSAKYLKLQ